MTTNEHLGATVIADPSSPGELHDRYQETRDFTEKLCETLVTEDYVIQTMPDVSPTKWHLGHTTWFFEAFILREQLAGYVSPNDKYNYLFNSYYNGIGEQWTRAERGHLSRPTVEQVYDFRRFADEKMHDLIDRAGRGSPPEQLIELTTLGINHEQQHQELLLTDIKHVLSRNPLDPVFRDLGPSTEPLGVPAAEWLPYDGGLVDVGFDGEGFHFDNEGPIHKTFVYPFHISSRLVTNGEFIEFMETGQYERPENWLSNGWHTIQREGWNSPLYWRKTDRGWVHFTLGGEQPVNPDEPVMHVSYYEADAYAKWKGVRLPSEDEWELASHDADISAGTFADTLRCHPRALAPDAAPGALHQMFGDVWEWTSSPYVGYPGFDIPPGAVGEYNGKFMSDQMVLRGGSAATSLSHIRPTYRNFFPSDARWQFMGFRLAGNAT